MSRRAAIPGVTCPKCGELHLARFGGIACVAHIKHGERKGERCRRSPTLGATVCKTHGAAAPQVKRLAKRRVTVAKVTKAIQGEVVGPVSDPFATLELLAGEAFRYFEVFRSRVEELQSVRYESGQGFEQIRGEAQLMGQYLDRAQKFAETLARLPLEERRVRVTEFQMRQVVTAFDAAVAAVALTPSQRDDLRVSMAGELRRLDTKA